MKRDDSDIQNGLRRRRARRRRCAWASALLISAASPLSSSAFAPTATTRIVRGHGSRSYAFSKYRATPSRPTSPLRSRAEDGTETGTATIEAVPVGEKGSTNDAANGATNGESNGSAPLATNGANGSSSSDVVVDLGSDGTGALSWAKQNIFLGIEPTPEIIAIMTIYFVEGALGLARLAQTFLLKDTLHLGPAELSALTGAFALPWTIKPLYGFLSDGFPLFGFRRRSYLVLAGIVGCLSYSALGSDFWGMLPTAENDPAASLPWTVAALLLSSGCIALSDVVADGVVVQRTRDSNDPRVAGGLQSLCWGSAAIGGLITAYFSGSLLEIMGPREVFGLTAFLPACVAAIALLIDEEPVGGKKGQKTEDVAGEIIDVTDQEEEGDLLEGVKSQIDGLVSAFRDPAIWKPALFLFLWQSTPTGEGAMLYFMTNDLGFGPEFLGRVRLVTALSSLVGVWAYQKYLRTIPIKDILFWTSIASTPLGLSNLLLITHMNRDLGIPDSAFVFGDDVALSILGELAFLPTLVLAARLCPPGIEAVLFASLMSIFNGASTVGTELGAALTKYLGVTESNFDNLALLTVICNVSSLYPLFLIGWLDGVGSKSEEEMEAERGEEGAGAAAANVLDVAAPPDMKGEY